MFLAGAAFIAAPLLCAAADTGWIDGVDVAFLGEVHDNPAHHDLQAEYVALLRPKALVFEMLTDAQAARITPELRADPMSIGVAVGWAEAGWPDFAMYAPIFAAAPKAAIYGAGVPRASLGDLSSKNLADLFGGQAARYGLDQPLPEDEQAAREALQFAAHCDALPEAMLPVMVDVQRLRDASIARAVERALDEVGPPVAVITGNGHARRDWGAPFILQQAREVAVFALGQGEDDVKPDGLFDHVRSAPAVERPDPCAVFRS